MRNKNQNGSAVVVVLVVIIVILIGALGYLFWKNTVGKTDKTVVHDTSQKKVTKKDELIKSATLKLDSRTLSFRYPDGWKLANVSESDPDQGKTVTSPGGDYVVTIQLLDEGLGGACGEGGPFITSKTTDLPNGTGEFLFEYTGTSKASGSTEYIASAVVEPNTLSKDQLAVGENVCNVTTGYFAANGGSDIEKDGVVAVAWMAPSTDGPGTFSSEAEAKQWMHSDEYKLGTKILLSLRG